MGTKQSAGIVQLCMSTTRSLSFDTQFGLAFMHS